VCWSTYINVNAFVYDSNLRPFPKGSPPTNTGDLNNLIMPQPSAAAKIYEREMYKLRHGMGIWEPEERVDIGDVGFLTEAGGFFRLFNVLLHENDTSQHHGVPEGFELLELPSHAIKKNDHYFHPDILQSQTVMRKTIGLEASR
jgi:hypothetical protein